jgi:4-hydroxyproline epimerase
MCSRTLHTPLYPDSIDIVDSHTGGEPTRVVLSGWPEPLGKTMEERARYVVEHQDHLRRGVVCEPRGHDAMVGALITAPIRKEALAGVIFFNDVGVLGMCGHALIGTVETLRFLGRIQGDSVELDTPAGAVSAIIDSDQQIVIQNVPSRLHQEHVEIEVPGIGSVIGDIAYGGNWFFLVNSPSFNLELRELDALMQSSKAIRKALLDQGLTGTDDAVIDHIEFFGPPKDPTADSRNFVLCPGNAYDRAPCGTGTSAKIATLHAKGQIETDQVWRQESITGSIYEASLRLIDGQLFPFIRSRAHITSKSSLLFKEADPLRGGLQDGATI